VIGAVEAGEPRLTVRAEIAGDGVPVALGRNEAGGGFFAVEVAHEAADGGDVGGDGVILRQQFGDRLGADVEGDVLVEQILGDAEIDVSGYGVGGVIGDQHDPAGGGRADLAEDFVHRSRPAMVHHADGMVAAAASRASGVS